jgi:DNA primase
MRDYVLGIIRRYVDERIKRSGDGQILVRCPFHKGGQERKPSFSVNVEEGLFHCFACHESGTIPMLLRQIGLPSHRIDAEVAPFKDQLKMAREIKKLRREAEYRVRDPFRAHTIIIEAICDGFDWCPTRLTQAGFSWQWLQYLQIGVDRRNHRITYPIRDIYGNLAGFSGGAVMAGQYPKYKVYKGRHKNFSGVVIPSDYGEWFDEEYPEYEFRNHDYLWNFDRVYPRLLYSQEVQPLIVVEGFKACIWLLQHGYRNTVALMGSVMSRKQHQLLLRTDCQIILFLDNDQPGQEGTYKIGNTLLRARPTVWTATYEKQHTDCSPDDLDSHFLRNAISGATRFRRQIRNSQ